MSELEMLLFFLPFIMGQLSPGEIGKTKIPDVGSIPKPKASEDSAAAAVIVVAASVGSFSNVPTRMRSWARERMEQVCNSMPKSSAFAQLIRTISRPSLLRANAGSSFVRLNSFLGEFFSCAILKKLDIATAPVEIVTEKEARTQPNAVVKFIQPDDPNGLKWDPGLEKRLLREESTDKNGSRSCLVSKLVPNAASLSYLRKEFGLVVKPSTWEEKKPADAFFEKLCGLFIGPAMENWAGVSDQYEALIDKAIGKDCTEGYRFYHDYSPHNREQIRDACAWNGPQFLRLCAARVFLGCSAPHYSNVLCTEDGQLVSIDHCMVVTDDGKSVRMLFEHTRRDTKAFDALRHVGKLTDDDIKEAVAQVPRHPACGSPADALERNLRAVRDFYIAQLKLWKRLLSEAEENVAGPVVSLRSERELQQTVQR